jgi:hypothetical protein
MRISKRISSEPAPEAVYVVPTKKEYMKHRVDKTKTWDDVYGHAKCDICKKKLVEGDEYHARNKPIPRKSGDADIEFVVVHVVPCEPPVKRGKRKK